MSEMVERVAEAIMKVDAEEKISDYYKWARAAIRATSQHLRNVAYASKFAEDKHAYFCAIEELEDQLKP